jgi:hypothetical protein
MSRTPQPTILKLIRGDLHPERLKNDKPKIDGKPQLPPGLDLTPDEQTNFNWLIEHVYVPGIHSTGDGPAFARIARMLVRAYEADAKIKQFGLVMRNPKNGKAETQPYFRISRDLWQQIGIALSEIGGTPAGRVKIAGPRTPGPGAGAPNWDEID